MELEGTPGAYRLRYELPVASVGPVKKNAVKICDWNGNTNNYKHNSTGQVCRETGDGDGDWGEESVWWWWLSWLSGSGW